MEIYVTYGQISIIMGVLKIKLSLVQKNANFSEVFKSFLHVEK